MFGDLDWPLNAFVYLSPSAELLIRLMITSQGQKNMKISFCLQVL